MSQPAFDFEALRRLPVSERLRLVEDLWDSIAEDAEGAPEALRLTPAQAAEMDRRLAEHERDPDSAVPFEEAMERVEARVRARRAGRGG
jgi:putative addiction module component (TIGR02574 family)